MTLEYPQLDRAAAEIDPDLLREAIWNALSTLGWEDHGIDDCEVCDTHREIIGADTTRIVAEYARLYAERLAEART